MGIYKKIKIDNGNTITPKLRHQGYNNKKTTFCHQVFKTNEKKPKKDDGVKIIIEIGW